MLDSLRSEPLVHGGHESTGADVFVKLFVVVVRYVELATVLVEILQVFPALLIQLCAHLGC